MVQISDFTWINFETVNCIRIEVINDPDKENIEYFVNVWFHGCHDPFVFKHKEAERIIRELINGQL